jgi:hypothetical protein
LTKKEAKIFIRNSVIAQILHWLDRNRAKRHLLNALNSAFSGTHLNICDVKKKLISIGYFLAVLSNILTFSFLNKKIRICKTKHCYT